MGISTPKQFSYLLGRPLISYCLESFERIPWIDNIVVTVSPESIQSMQDIVSCFNHKRVLLVPGGFVRHRSIYNGVKALEKVSPDVVVIHDAVRPLVDEDTVKQVAVAAWEYGSSGAVRPLVSTVIATDLDGFLDHSLDRSKYRSSEMPQAFCYDVLCKAYQKATDYDFDYGTECLHLVNKYTDARTRLIDGPEHLWKVTYKKDMFALEGLLKEQENVVGISSVIPVNFRDLITAAVLARCMKVCPVDDISSAPEDINNFVFTATSDCLESFQGFLDAALHNLLKLNRRGTLVCVLSHCEASVDGGNSHVEFQRIVKGKSREARSHGVCVNGAVCQDLDHLQEVSEIIASLVFDRNFVYNGQVLVV
ncbi:D-ribitol-5-phosphate cytidylyltransferase [Lamellibrachia satsuma]|nr:D-ribitol-5-phosphate cytidylyltransferase [Lamellibrachia satsuma]